MEILIPNIACPGDDATIPSSDDTPFTPGHRDPWDKEVVTVGNGMKPLPFRNGEGGSHTRAT
jgi:hypothetical protein